jgi:ribosomal protein L25 (general stress protein Ctc)
MEKKVMNALFEEELNMEAEIKYEGKKEVALVTQLPIETVSKTLGKFD